MDNATPEKALETFGPDHKQLVFVVDWTSDIVQISYDFQAMQGGEIAKNRDFPANYKRARFKLSAVMITSFFFLRLYNVFATGFSGIAG